MDQSKVKIDKTTIALMLVTAILFDALSIIPVVNWFSLFFAYMTFAFWFTIKGVSLFGFRKIVSSALGAIVEAIPAVSFIPSIFLVVLLIIALEKAKEKGFDIKGVIKNPNIISAARKVASPEKPNVVTLSRKSVSANERVNTRKLRRVT